MDSKPRILIAVPAYGQQLLVPFVSSLFNLSARLTAEGIFHDIRILSDSLIPRLRNTFAAGFLNSDFSHILYLDADLQWSPDLVMRLLSVDKDLIGAACAKKSLSFDKIAVAATVGVPAPSLADVGCEVAVAGIKQSDVSKFKSDVIPVGAVGAGVLLVRRTVFEKLARRFPELEYRIDEAPGQRFYDFFAPYIRSDDKLYIPEDYALCTRAATVGVQPYLLTSHKTTHWGLFGFSYSRAAHQQLESQLAAIQAGSKQ